MHATEHKRCACSVPAWERKNASRRCEHGDSALKGSSKRTARKNRRSADKSEARASAVSW